MEDINHSTSLQNSCTQSVLVKPVCCRYFHEHGWGVTYRNKYSCITEEPTAVWMAIHQNCISGAPSSIRRELWFTSLLPRNYFRFYNIGEGPCESYKFLRSGSLLIPLAYWFLWLRHPLPSIRKSIGSKQMSPNKAQTLILCTPHMESRCCKRLHYLLLCLHWPDF